MSSNRVLRVIKTIVLSICSWILVLPILVILLPALCIAIPYKHLVNLVTRLKNSSWIPLTGLDTVLALDLELYKNEGKLLSNIGFALVLHEIIDISEFRKRVHERLLNARVSVNEELINTKYKFDRLRRLPVKFMGYLYWNEEIEDLDLEKLIIERRSERTDLEAFISEWIHKGYEKESPLWELILYRDEDQYFGKTVIIFKMAHALGNSMISSSRVFTIGYPPFRRRILP